MEDNDLSLSSLAADAADGTAALMADASDSNKIVTSEKLLAAILKSLDQDKTEEIVQIDLRGKSEIGDYMVIGSGRSTRQVAAISEKLTDMLKAEFGVISKVEGKSAGDWVLIDAGDVVVHIFRPEVREFYQLEKMWLSPRQDDSQTAASI